MIFVIVILSVAILSIYILHAMLYYEVMEMRRNTEVIDNRISRVEGAFFRLHDLYRKQQTKGATKK